MTTLKHVFAIIIISALAPSLAWADPATRTKAKPHPVLRKPAAKTRVAARQPVSRVVTRGPASVNTGVQESDKALKINGQARSINMTLVLKGDKDEINFVKPRTSFQDKIGETKF